jgi:hypothetical protein
VLLRRHDAHRESVSEEVSPTGVPAVEALGIAEQQAVHPAGQVVRARLEDEVDVVAHQAEGADVPAVPIGRLLEVGQEREPVVSVAEDAAPPDAAGGDVEQAVTRRHEVPWNAWHAAERTRALTPLRRREHLDTQSAHATRREGTCPGDCPRRLARYRRAAAARLWRYRRGRA